LLRGSRFYDIVVQLIYAKLEQSELRAVALRGQGARHEQIVKLRARAQMYLRERRRLGFELRSMGYALRSFAHMSTNSTTRAATLEVMAEWARRDKAQLGSAHLGRRLKILRPSLAGCGSSNRAPRCRRCVFGRVGERLTPTHYHEKNDRSAGGGSPLGQRGLRGATTNVVRLIVRRVFDCQRPCG